MKNGFTQGLMAGAKLYGRLLSYIKPYLTMFIIGLLAAIPSGAMDGVISLLAGQGVQKILVEGHKSKLYFIPIAVMGIAVVQGFFQFLETYCIRKVGASAIADLRNELFTHLEKQPIRYILSTKSGVLVSRIINDVNIIENAISQAFQTMISRFITLISLAFVLIYQSWYLSLIALSIFTLIVPPVAYLGSKIRKASKRGQEAIGDLSAVLTESIQGSKIVTSFNLEEYQIGKFKQTNRDFLRSMIKATKSEAIQSPILTLIGAAGIAAVVYVAGHQVVNHELTIGALTSFIIALILLYSPLKTMGRVNGIVQPALAAATRIFEVLDKEPEMVDSPGAIDLPQGSHDLKLDKVGFVYPGQEKRVLDDITIDIPSGTMVALVGLSGAGKSTIANLVPRFYDVTDGAIYIDGKALPEYTMKSLRRQIAMVTQDNFLFHTTVGENIRLGKVGATEEQIIEAAKAAYCHDFIMALPDGYNTEIGERGVRLSGGQQQRVAIARAILKDAPILILDEATSSLDNESEAYVQKALNNLMKNRTTIVIAHRLSTIRNADKILVLDQGKIAEQGTHLQLEKQSGIYARLLAAQFERTSAMT
ncbi:MAG: ABC transporter transmembrane domain-containing protein [Candidatus Melainabacteria bacterium]|nr:ABC transporter transmembrane domain-containing protein [Candidatus Melainabacteria bacterium]